jgi:tetratricopeptide (TPR) repeat protein
LRHAEAAPETAQSLAVIANAQEKLNHPLEAERAYEAAVRLAPDQESYRIALALELIQHHTFEAAIAVARQAIPLFPQSARLRILLGMAQYGAERRDEAIATLTEAAEIKPQLEPAFVYLAKIVLETAAAPRRRTVDVLCQWNETVCGAAKLRVAHQAGDQGYMQEAIKMMATAPADNVTARCELGRAYDWTAQWQQAREEMERCVALDSAPQNHYRLSAIYGHLGMKDHQKAQLALYNERVRQVTKDVERRRSTLDTFLLTNK